MKRHVNKLTFDINPKKKTTYNGDNIGHHSIGRFATHILTQVSRRRAAIGRIYTIRGILSKYNYSGKLVKEEIIVNESKNH